MARGASTSAAATGASAECAHTVTTAKRSSNSCSVAAVARVTTVAPRARTWSVTRAHSSTTRGRYSSRHATSGARPLPLTTVRTKSRSAAAASRTNSSKVSGSAIASAQSAGPTIGSTARPRIALDDRDIEQLLLQLDLEPGALGQQRLELSPKFGADVLRCGRLPGELCDRGFDVPLYLGRGSVQPLRRRVAERELDPDPQRRLRRHRHLDRDRDLPGAIAEPPDPRAVDPGLREFDRAA